MFAASGAVSGMKYSVYVRYTFWGWATRSWIMWLRTQVWPVVYRQPKPVGALK
jgi:hypothetical protein